MPMEETGDGKQRTDRCGQGIFGNGKWVGGDPFRVDIERRDRGRNMYHGWLQDGIWDLAKSDWEVFQKLPYCLVTCVDSSSDVAFMARVEGIIEKETSCSVLGNGLLIGGARVVDVSRSYNLFNGFDEIWLYEDCPTTAKPESFWIVSPLDLNNDPLPQGLLTRISQMIRPFLCSALRVHPVE